MGPQSRKNCYNKIPLKIDEKYYFLEIVTLRIVERGENIPCDKPKKILIIQMANVTLRLDSTGRLTKKTAKNHVKIDKRHFSVLDIFNKKLLHYTEKTEDRTYLFGEVKSSIDTWKQLQTITDRSDDGDFLRLVYYICNNDHYICVNFPKIQPRKVV